MTEKNNQKRRAIPLLPLRDIVVYPNMVIPLFVGRKDSIAALEHAMTADKAIFLVSQIDPEQEEPTVSDLYQFGTLATILQMLRLPDGTVKLLVEGDARAVVHQFKKTRGYLAADIVLQEEQFDITQKESRRLMRMALGQFEKLVKNNKKIPSELLNTLSSIKDASRLADSIAAHMTVHLSGRQQVLEALSISERFSILFEILAEELDLSEVDKRVQGRVKDQVEKSQRQYYLSEKMKAIQQELGELDEYGAQDDIEQIHQKILQAQMSPEAEEKALSEWSKLKAMPPMSAEATVSRNYLDWLIQVPWHKKSHLSEDLPAAEAVLEKDHFGLEEVKERIIEYLAVGMRVKKMKSPILCLVGPPGVGKTSLGQSIANATGRPFVRISLGGVRDEAEIRGHRRTYIGALPGKIIQKLAKSGVRNPLFMLDEVDKMAMDFRGDPASALLEVLDPEQNHTFSDHYLEVDYDLSDVMFIATANSMNIPAPLLDRMEVIRLSGYTENEKLNIAKRYLLPRQREYTGIKASEIKVSDSALMEIIRCYTKEAGVRSLDRALSKVCRKVVKALVSGDAKAAVKITAKNIVDYLGVSQYRYGAVNQSKRIGEVTGLAWTSVGGELLTLEVQVVPGKGKIVSTGHLGQVMQESIQAALTVVRARHDLLYLPENYFHEHDFHIHVPEGAIPKDGPSAGIGICTAIFSAVSQCSVKSRVAMTGEITLHGGVLPIGGLKEKLLAARRGGIKTVLIPNDNARHLGEIPEDITSGLNIHPVESIDQVLALAVDYPCKKQPGAIKTKPQLKTTPKKFIKAPHKKDTGNDVQPSGSR